MEKYNNIENFLLECAKIYRKTIHHSPEYNYYIKEGYKYISLVQTINGKYKKKIVYVDNKTSDIFVSKNGKSIGNLNSDDRGIYLFKGVYN